LRHGPASNPPGCWRAALDQKVHLGEGLSSEALIELPELATGGTTGRCGGDRIGPVVVPLPAVDHENLSGPRSDSPKPVGRRPAARKVPDFGLLLFG
jgi:hypothetical protein